MFLAARISFCGVDLSPLASSSTTVVSWVVAFPSKKNQQMVGYRKFGHKIYSTE